MKKNFKKWDSMSESEKQEAKQRQEDAIKSLENELENGIIETMQEDNFKNYLNAMNKFHSYSFRNIILVLKQAQERNTSISNLAGFTTWKKLNRFVKAGEKGYKIFAPVPHRYTKTVQNDDGTEEEKECCYNTYKVTTTFDVAQTDGAELPKICNELLTGVDDFEKIIKLLIKIAPCPVEFKEIDFNAYGYYDPLNNRIVVENGIGQLQAIKTLCHEIAHSVMHNLNVSGAMDLTSAQKEIQAESVAYILCNYLGFDTSDYSFEYLAFFSRDNIDDFKKS